MARNASKKKGKNFFGRLRPQHQSVTFEKKKPVSHPPGGVGQGLIRGVLWTTGHLGDRQLLCQGIALADPQRKLCEGLWSDSKPDIASLQ